jgi:hypothetical protein
MRVLHRLGRMPGLLRNRNTTRNIDRHGRSERTMSTSTASTRGTANTGRRRQPTTGVGRLVRRLERERRSWARRPERDGPVVPTEVAWRAGVAEGLRLAQAAIRKGV